MLRRHYIDNCRGGQIHFAQSGGDGDPILLLHQTPRSWDEFHEIIGVLEGRYRLYAMDLPGMGASDAFGQTATIEDYAKAAALLVEFIGAPVVACGHHTGGVVAMELATSRPELVQKLVLSSTPWVDAAARTERAQKSTIDTATHTTSGDHLQNYWMQRAPYYPDDPIYLDRFMRDALQARDASEGHLAVGRYKMENAAAHINVPTLIVEHQADPFAVKHTSKLTAAIPNADVRAIADGKVPLECSAKEFAETLHNWLVQTTHSHAQ